jgi:hypothetical protein
MINSMRGEFEALLAGEMQAFDTNLGTIAAIEDACGDASIVDILDRCVFGRRAGPRMALITAALMAGGRDKAAAERLSARTASAEAEAFILAMMRALGFEIAAKAPGNVADGGETGGARPLDGASAGGAGGNSA